LRRILIGARSYGSAARGNNLASPTSLRGRILIGARSYGSAARGNNLASPTSLRGRILILAALIAACGYRPLANTLPGGRHSVRVLLPDPSRTDEPQLAAMLAGELCRELARAGIRADTASPADSELQTKIISLTASHPVLGEAKLAARTLTLRLELVLFDRGGATLWRSGLLEVEAPWALGNGAALTAEAARRRTLAALSVEAARRAVMMLTTR
jgi:hypothetical protein